MCGVPLGDEQLCQLPLSGILRRPVRKPDFPRGSGIDTSLASPAAGKTYGEENDDPVCHRLKSQAEPDDVDVAETSASSKRIFQLGKAALE